MNNKKNVIFSISILGKGFSILKKEPPKPKTKKQKPITFQYF